jgi:y4mF family transcriptional regulator
MLLHIKRYICLKSMQMHITMKTLATFVKEKRNEVNLTQEAFAEHAGVALTVVRKIEQGKGNLNLGKVNQVLKMFGHTLAPVSARELLKIDNPIE